MYASRSRFLLTVLLAISVAIGNASKQANDYQVFGADNEQLQSSGSAV